MNNKLAEIFSRLTNEELNEAFLNIKELHEKGELGNDNAFRRIGEVIERELGVHYPIHALEREILYWFATRAYPLPNESHL